MKIHRIVFLFLFLLIVSGVGAQGEPVATFTAYVKDGAILYAIALTPDGTIVSQELIANIGKADLVTDTGLIYGFRGDEFQVRSVWETETPSPFSFERVGWPAFEDVVYARTQDGRDVFVILYKDLDTQEPSKLIYLQYANDELTVVSRRSTGQFFCNKLAVDAQLNVLLGCEDSVYFEPFVGDRMQLESTGPTYLLQKCGAKICFTLRQVVKSTELADLHEYVTYILEGSTFVRNETSANGMSWPIFVGETAFSRGRNGRMYFYTDKGAKVWPLLEGTYQFRTNPNQIMFVLMRRHGDKHELCAHPTGFGKWSCGAVKGNKILAITDSLN